MNTTNITIEETSINDEYYYDREYYRDEKQCFVPYCKKKRRDNKKLRYFNVPKSLKAQWCLELKTNCPARALHVCEDHIDVKQDCFRTSSGNLRLKNTVNLSLIKKTFVDVAVQCQPYMRHVSVCAKPSVRSIECLANIEVLSLDEKTLPSTPRHCENVQSVPCMSSSTTTPRNNTIIRVRDFANPTLNLPPSSTRPVLTQAASQPIKEESDTISAEIKMEFEDSETEFTEQNYGTTDCLESELATDKEYPVVTIEQFLKGCELYLTPELRDYVKTQVKRPI